MRYLPRRMKKLILALTLAAFALAPSLPAGESKTCDKNKSGCAEKAGCEKGKSGCGEKKDGCPAGKDGCPASKGDKKKA